MSLASLNVIVIKKINNSSHIFKSTPEGAVPLLVESTELGVEGTLKVVPGRGLAQSPVEDGAGCWITAAADSGAESRLCHPSLPGHGTFRRKSLSGHCLASLSMEASCWSHRLSVCRRGGRRRREDPLGMMGEGREVCLLAFLDGLLGLSRPRMPCWLLQRLRWGQEGENIVRGRCCLMIRVVALPHAPDFHLHLSPWLAPASPWHLLKG